MIFKGDRSACNFSSYWTAISTSARSFDPEHVAGFCVELGFGWNCRLFAATDQGICAWLSRLTTLQPIRTAGPPVGQNRRFCAVQKLPLTYNAIASAPEALSARSSPNTISADSQRQLMFKRFNGRIPTVRHMRMGS
jgi:hypothetical protein